MSAYTGYLLISTQIFSLIDLLVVVAIVYLLILHWFCGSRRLSQSPPISVELIYFLTP